MQYSEIQYITLHLAPNVLYYKMQYGRVQYSTGNTVQIIQHGKIQYALILHNFNTQFAKQDTGLREDGIMSRVKITRKYSAGRVSSRNIYLRVIMLCIHGSTKTWCDMCEH